MNARDYGAAALAGFIGGNVSSFIKWGTEIPMPPRAPGRSLPPLEMLKETLKKTSKSGEIRQSQALNG